MKSKKEIKLYQFMTMFILFCLAFIFLPASMFPQGNVVSSVVSSNNSPVEGDTITLAIKVDMSSSPELLGSFTAILNWNPAVLKFLSHAGLQQSFVGIVNTDHAESGNINFNGANPNGVNGVFDILSVNFKVIGSAGSSTVVDLEYQAMATAITFVNLLTSLTVNDVTITVSPATGIGDNLTAIPKDYSLLQNYPNPFNPVTIIRDDLPKNVRVILKIFDLLGREVRTLVDGHQSAGNKIVTWNGRDMNGKTVSSGIYIYQLQANKYIRSRKMILLR